MTIIDMNPETKEKIGNTLRQSWMLSKRIAVGIGHSLKLVSNRLYELARTFCESHRTISAAKEEARRATEENARLREELDSMRRHLEGERYALESTRSQLDVARADVQTILGELKRRSQGLADKLNHNIMHSSAPAGVVIDKTVRAWFADFQDWWNSDDDDGINANDDPDETSARYDDNGDDAYGKEEDNEDNEEDDDDKGDEDDDEEDEDDGDEGNDGEDDVNGDEECKHDYDPSRSGSDLDQSFLETANDLFERLDELPKKCDRYTVRFVAVNSDIWIQPEEWHIDDEDGCLVFGLIDGGKDHDDEELTIADLKNILTGGCDEGDFGVEEDTPIYVDDSGDSFRLLDEYFKIRWKERLVEIPMIEACEDGEDDGEDGDEEEEEEEEEEDNSDDGEDEDTGDDEDDGEVSDEEEEDEDDEEDEEDNDDDDEGDLDEDEDDEDGSDDDEEDDEDDDENAEGDENDDGSGGRSGSDSPVPQSDIALGLVLDHAFEQWKSGKR